MAAITFPLDWPDVLDLVNYSFDLVPNVNVRTLRRGTRIAVDLGPATWVVDAQSVPLDEEALGQVRALFDLLSSTEDLLVYEHLREYPLRYPRGWGDLQVGGHPFTGSGLLAAVSDDSKIVTIDHLPVGLQLSRGDYVAWPYNDGAQALHRCSVDAVADAGGSLSVEVRPYIEPLALSPSPVVALHRACARMAVVPDSLKIQINGDRNGVASFRLEQVD